MASTKLRTCRPYSEFFRKRQGAEQNTHNPLRNKENYMRRIVIIGNSGSGKSTRASELCAAEGLAHLDLDTLAWLPTTPPQRRPLEASKIDILDFTNTHSGWVIEGCYGDLIKIALPFANHLIFMNLSVAQCIENARKRPWEPHKYPSKKAQDENLNMLIEWISHYDKRNDTFSYATHRALYDEFTGTKDMITGNA